MLGGVVKGLVLEIEAGLELKLEAEVEFGVLAFILFGSDGLLSASSSVSFSGQLLAGVSMVTSGGGMLSCRSEDTPCKGWTGVRTPPA